MVKERISKLIQAIVDGGAKLVLDGRQITVSKYELGNFIGPTILSDIKGDLERSKEEILGPVLLCMQANSIDEAINFVNQNKYFSVTLLNLSEVICFILILSFTPVYEENIAMESIFTSSGALARKFQIEIETRQVCINTAVPAPLPLFCLTGSELSFVGDLNANGKPGVHFYTQAKTVTQQWKEFNSNEEDRQH